MTFTTCQPTPTEDDDGLALLVAEITVTERMHAVRAEDELDLGVQIVHVAGGAL